MAVSPEDKTPIPKMDSAALYREETFTDRKVGTIRRMSPVKTDGSPDPDRRVVYIGEAQLMTTVGALPLNFEISASSLEEAVAKYADAAKLAFERAVKELQELRRQAASSIVIPEKGVGGFGPGGLPGGGKIQVP